MMKIAIELRQIRLGSSGGIVFHLKGLLPRLFSIAPDVEFLLFSTPFNQQLFSADQDNVRSMTLEEDSYFEQVDRICARESVDVLFRSYPMLDPLEFPLAQQIFFMPDLQHEYFPEYFSPPELRYRRLSFNRGLAGAGGIATNSRYTRGTILGHEWNRCRNIAIVSPGSPEAVPAIIARGLSEAEQRLIPPGDYFFYPANLWAHKNHRRVLAAFAHFLESGGRDVEFVFTGHPDGWQRTAKGFRHLPIRHLGFVSDELLRELYRRARALVFFSCYEGFGMPLLEAFSLGTPVICSNTTSLPEVGGNAILACDPADVNAMAGLMSRILEDSDLASRLVDEGRKRLRQFSWQQSAQNLLDACKEVAAQETVERPLQNGHPPAWEPLVSVVTPSFNQGRFIRRTIDSVLAQSYPRIQYVVIDGGSSDDTREILRSYGNAIAWISEPDGGQTDAINKGMAMSQGEILCYLNSDDVLMPDAIATAVAYFGQHPETDMVYGKAVYIDESDARTGVYNTDDYSFERLMFDCCVCQPAAFWRKRIANRVGEFDRRLDYVMDYDYWLRIDRAGGSIQHIPQTLAASRLYPETKTLSSRREIYREIFRVCYRHGGYVDRNYFFGLWHHLTHENSHGWLGKAAWLKKYFIKAAVVHHWIFHLVRNPGRIRLPRFLSNAATQSLRLFSRQSVSGH
jgi:glycosyltransferase involved in cell wall biosynthesis